MFDSKEVMIEERELKSRRKFGWEFNSFSEYNKTLKKIVGFGEKIPAVISRFESSLENLSISYIYPMMELDLLRVRNFSLGVSCLDKHLKSIGRSLNGDCFSGRIDVGVEGRARENLGDSFFYTSFNINGINYDLNLDLTCKKCSNKLYYLSKSGINLPPSFEILNSFIGPKYNL